jgi:hypothetical protein
VQSEHLKDGAWHFLFDAYHTRFQNEIQENPAPLAADAAGGLASTACSGVVIT